MKTLKRIFVVAIFFSLTTVIFAQEDILDKYANLRNERDSIQKLLNEKVEQIEQLQTKNNEQAEEITVLKTQVAELETTNKTLVDSTNNLNTKIESYANMNKNFDDLRLRYANGRLQLPYDKESADNAIKLFNEVSDPGKKEKYIDIKTCLNDYPTAKGLVVQTLTTLQGSMEGQSKFTVDKWKAEANSIIEGDSYTNVYKKNYKNNVSIYYLDNILKEAKARVATTKDPKQVSFEDLIIRLQM